MRQTMSEIWMRCRALLRRRKAHDEVEAELQHHLEMETAARIAEGLSPEEARRQATLDFGSVASVREACREESGGSGIEDFVRDLVVGTRSLLRTPSFTIASLLSLGLGVGAATVIFAVVDASILRPLPFERPEEVVRLYEITPEGDLFSTSDLNVIDFRERSRTLVSIAATPSAAPTQDLLFEPQQSQSDVGEASRLTAALVTGNFFDVLGVHPIIGRTWDADESRPGERPRSAVLGHALWQSAFGGDTSVVGTTMRLGGEAWTILGVLPERFRFDVEADLWIPFALEPEHPRGDHRLMGLARLAPGATLESAKAEMRSIMQDLAKAYPEAQAGWGSDLIPIEDELLGEDARTASIALVVAVLLLLTLACANVSSLLLARATGRARELAMRRALGAGRGRLVRQLLTESTALGLVGAAVGLLLASISLPLIRILGDGGLPRIEDASIDPRAAAVAAFLALVTSVLFGTMPALSATAGGRSEGLVRGGEQRRGNGLRAALVGGQLALSLVLTASSLLLLTSLGSLRTIPVGFDTDDLIALDLTLHGERYASNSAIVGFYRDVLEKVRAIPGVAHAGAHTTHPFRGPTLANTIALPEITEKSAFIETGWRSVTPGTFRTLGMPLLRGRDFREQESGLVTILSASLAERLFGSDDPIGKEVRWRHPQGPLARVVGIVPDVRDMAVDRDPEPMYYWFQGQMVWRDLTLLVRSELPAEQLAAPLRAAIRGVDPSLAPPAVERVRDDLVNSLATPRLSFRVFTAFAAIALTIAVVGLYGLIAFAAARRQRELAVRVALGARPGSIRRLLLGQGLRLVIFGLAAGLLGMWALSTLLRRLLYDVSALDPGILALSAGTFAAAALIACLIPALRAARQSPLRALRSD